MKPPKLFLRTRIFLSMIFLVLISFLLTGIVTNYQIRESSDYYHGLRLERKEAQIQRALRSLLEERSLLEDNQLSFLFNQRPEQNISINTVLDSILTNEIVKISEIQNINFTLYDIDGSLIGSTVSDEETESLSNQVLTDLEKSEDSKIVITKSGDETLLRSSFSYIFNINEKPIWILNFPYIDDDRLNTYEINSYILNLVQVYFLLFVLAIMISYLVSSYITNPISALIFKMKQMRLDKINKKIDLKVNSKEMYSLVNSYNNMVTQIDNNVKKLSKSQRELAWREMAKQVAHEIKNPLTPMKLSVQNFKLKFDPNDVKRFWLHQANGNMINFVAKKLKGEDYDPNAAPMILEKYGNVASAGSLIAFHETKDDFQSGEMGVICSFGAGYSVCSLIVEKV